MAPAAQAIRRFFYYEIMLNIAKPRFCLQNVVVKPQARFVGAPLIFCIYNNLTRTMFSLRLCCQRKAANPFCYQRSFIAFSFEARGPKEKALQKENAVFSLKPLGFRF